MQQTIDLVKFLKKSMPEVTYVDIAKTYLNWAYKELVQQDVAEYLLFNRDDEHFPYPILRVNPEVPPDPPDDPWYLDWDNSTLDKITYNVNQGNFCDTSGALAVWEIETSESIIYPVARKVANIFTIRNSKTHNDFPNIYRPVFFEEYPNNFYSKYEFVKVPFHQTSKRQNQTPRITFVNKFEDYEVPFFAEIYYEPPDLLTMNSLMDIDVVKWWDTLYYGAISRYEHLVHGETSKANEFAIRKQIFKDEMNSSSHNWVSQKFPNRSF